MKVEDDSKWEYLPVTFEQALNLYRDTQVYWLGTSGSWYLWFHHTADADSVRDKGKDWAKDRLSIKVRRLEQ